MKKIIITVLSIMLTMFALTACSLGGVLKGDRGLPGIQGIQGEKGEKGNNGADGQDGIDGIDGQDGADGQQGEQGPGVSNVTFDLPYDFIFIGDLFDIETGYTVITTTVLTEKIIFQAYGESATYSGNMVKITVIGAANIVEICNGNSGANITTVKTFYNIDILQSEIRSNSASETFLCHKVVLSFEEAQQLF